jgi:hypothetical protein
MALDPHPLDPNPEHLSRDPAYQYAASHKLSNDVIMLLPLPDGRYAVMNSARQIQGYLPGEARLDTAAATRCPPRPSTVALGRIIYQPDPDIEIEL